METITVVLLIFLVVLVVTLGGIGVYFLLRKSPGRPPKRQPRPEPRPEPSPEPSPEPEPRQEAPPEPKQEPPQEVQTETPKPITPKVTYPFATVPSPSMPMPEPIDLPEPQEYTGTIVPAPLRTNFAPAPTREKIESAAAQLASEAAKKLASETAKRAQKAEEAAKRLAEEAAKRAQKAEEAAKRLAEEAAKKLASEAAERARKAEEAAKRLASEAARRAEEAAKKLASEAAKKVQQAEEAAKKLAAKAAKKAEKAAKKAAKKIETKITSAAVDSKLNPHMIPDFVLESMKLDAEQLSTILSLIGGPEQSNVNWWLGANGKSVYGYCEDIGDGRGVTMGLAGFVTKYGEVEDIMKEYGVSMKSVGDPKDCKKHDSSCAFCRWIEARGDDPKWIAAQWKQYKKEYMDPVNKYIPKQFENNALIRGLLLDTSMNSGIGSEGNAWGMDKMAKEARGNTPLEWVNNFCDIRYDHFASGNPESSRKGRLETWRALARDGKWDMRGVNPCKYAFCYGKKLGEWCKGC